MKGNGPKHERETIITFNEEDDSASIWTASETVYRRLRKLGYMPLEDGERHAVFTMPKREVKLPRPKRAVSEAQRERLRTLKPRREGVSLTVLPSRLKANAPNPADGYPTLD